MFVDKICPDGTTEIALMPSTGPEFRLTTEDNDGNDIDLSGVLPGTNQMVSL